jgi:NDP-sugar pyrophosphorylase family protein
VIRRAMVLAAGFGTRLRPLTLTTPKPLVPVADRPFLDHLLAWLRGGGIREVVINLHHLGALIERHVGDGSRFRLSVRYSPEPTILDTGGGIKHAERLLAGEPFVVANADSLLEVSLHELCEFHRARGGVATMALRADPDAARYGLVEVDDGARVRRIVGLPPDAAASGLRGLMFPGLHVLEPSIFAYMEPGRAFSITRTTYPAVLAAGLPIFGFETAARWINIDTPDAVAAADRELRTRPALASP